MRFGVGVHVCVVRSDYNTARRAQINESIMKITRDDKFALRGALLRDPFICPGERLKLSLHHLQSKRWNNYYIQRRCVREACFLCAIVRAGKKRPIYTYVQRREDIMPVWAGQ